MVIVPYLAKINIMNYKHKKTKNSEWLLDNNLRIDNICLECCFCRINNPNCEYSEDEYPDNPNECGYNTHYERKN